MRHLRAAVVLTIALVLPIAVPAPAGALDEAAVGKVTEAIIQNHIQPGYERLLGETELLADAMTALCASPAPESLARARARFGDVVRSWSRIAHIRFGPVAEANRYERIHFWPDPRGIGLRQIQRLIAGADESLLEPGTFAGQSVAVQGLGALEFVLFGTGADDLAAPPTESFRCRYGVAIAASLTGIEAAIDRDWANPDGYARLLRAPGPDNPLHRDHEEVLSKYIGTLAQGFEAIRDQKLLPVLGEDAGSARPNLAIFRRSGLTLAAIAAEFAGLAHMFEVSGLALLLPAEEQWMGGSVLFEFRNVERTLGEIDGTFGEAATEEDGRGKLTYLVILSRSLQRLIVRNMAQELGLTIGFSALDGD